MTHSVAREMTALVYRNVMTDKAKEKDNIHEEVPELLNGKQ